MTVSRQSDDSRSQFIAVESCVGLLRQIFVKVVVGIFALTVSLAAFPATSTAATNTMAKSWCTDMGILETSGGVVDADTAQTLERSAPQSVSAATWAGSVKAFHDDDVAYAKCATGTDRDLTGAYLALWKAILEHHSGTGSWRDDLNTSTQIFQKCVTRFYGTSRGGKCETMVRENIKRQQQWDPD